jgi:hypothetical protein
MRDEILQVADALYWDAMGARQYLYNVIAVPGATIDEEKDAIRAWTGRLYIANQITYILTYAHHGDCSRKLDLFDDSDPWNHGADLIQNPARFYRVLESVRYNLYSNGGQVMLSGPDMQILDSLIATLARVIVGEYQKTQGVRVI